jgi:hypothetical protein
MGIHNLGSDIIHKYDVLTHITSCLNIFVDVSCGQRPYKIQSSSCA